MIINNGNITFGKGRSIIGVTPFASHPTLNNNLTSYWKFDEISGNIVTDSLGLYTGSVAPECHLTSSGVFNTCISNADLSDWQTGFPSVTGQDTEYLNVEGSSLIISDEAAFSFNGWFYYNNFNSPQYIIDHRDGMELFITTNDQRVTFYLPIDTPKMILTWDNPFQTFEHEWSMLTLTFSGGNNATGITLYHNGIEVTKLNPNETTGSVTNTGDPVYIGGHFNTPTAAWYGSIDEVGCWSKELTQQEITDLYNNGNALPYSI